MSSQMQAAQVVEHKKPYKINIIGVPEPQNYDLLIKIGAAGYCHTDSMVAEGAPGIPLADLPVTGSHEPSGTVVGVGSKAKGFKKGDRVASLTFRDPCGQCADCKAGNIKFCDNAKFAGLTENGAFAEYCIVDSRSSAKLPDTLSFSQAAPHTCAGATIWGAIQACNLQAGQSLAIVGLGALGHIGVQLAKCLGLRVVGVDARAEPLELVRSLKHAPDLALDARDGPDVALRQIKQTLRLEDGVDAVIDATGVTGGHEICLKIVRKHGLFILVSQPPEPLKLDFNSLIFRDITVKGSLLASPQQFQDLLNFVVKHDIKVEVREYELDNVNKMVEDAHGKSVTGKAVVVF